MAGENQNDSGQSQNQESSADETEVKFWDRLEKTVRKQVAEELEERIKNSKPTGTSRTGRKTIPDMLADIMWPQSK